MTSYELGCITAAIAIVAEGSMFAPIKCRAARQVNIDPLVFLTYMTAWTAIFSWAVIFFGVKPTLEPIAGILSGLLLIPGSLAVLFAVKEAGLAVGKGTSSSLKILVSFIWGVIIFDEKVKSIIGAIIAIIIMMSGVWGMSYYSSPVSSVKEGHNPAEENNEEEEILLVDVKAVPKYSEEQSHSNSQPLENIIPPNESGNNEMIEVCGLRMTRRRAGVLCAMFDGIWGGSVLVPMHYTKYKTNGIGFVLSIVFGDNVVILLFWLMRYLYHLHKTQNFMAAYTTLPSFHLNLMFIPSALSGLLQTYGGIAAILSVSYLGYAAGFATVQASILVAGLWGIFYFKEVCVKQMVMKWFASAFMTLFGIAYLLYQRKDM